MTETCPRELARRLYDAINRNDLEALDGLFAPDVVRHAAGEIGAEKALDAVRELHAAPRSTRFRIDDLFAEDDRVALRVTVHQGGPDGPDEPVSTILEIFRIADGRVAEIWGAGADADGRARAARS